MRIVGFFSILCVASLSHVTVSSAQTGQWTVVTSAHDTLRSCAIGKVEADVCQFMCQGSVIRITVDSLSVLSRHKESHFWRGAGYGALAGSALGALLGVASYDKSTSLVDFGPGFEALVGAITLGVAGGAIGGIIGATSGGEETVDLSRESTTDRIRILQDLHNEDN